jgi:hypothetical protein
MVSTRAEMAPGLSVTRHVAPRAGGERIGGTVRARAQAQCSAVGRSEE